MNWQPLLTADIYQAKSFLDYLKAGKGLSYNTIGIYLSALKGFYDEVIASGFEVRENPFASPVVKIPRGTRKASRPTSALTRSEVAHVLAFHKAKNTPPRKRNSALLALLFGCGLRRAELLNLRVRDVVNNKAVWTLRLLGTKNDVYREKAMQPWVSRALFKWTRQLKAEPDARIFDLSEAGFYKLFIRLVRDALPEARVSPHSARCSAINALLDNGVPLRSILNFSGHKSVHSVEVYDRRLNQGRQDPGMGLDYGVDTKGRKRVF